jgi:phage gpG-like protein
MIKFVTQWFGLDTLAQEEFEKLRRPTEIAITKATLYFEGRVKRKLGATPARTGRVYGDHQASAPGEPPAPLSTDLRRSITHTPVMWEGDIASAQVGTALPYAMILEWGGVIRRVSKKGNAYVIRILPRPYFASTWLEEEARIQAILDGAVRNAPVLVDVVPEVENGTGSSGRDRAAAARKGWETRRARG